MANNPDIYLKKSKAAVSVTTGYSEDQLYVVWFAKTLGNFKALVSTDVNPGYYWEVTHNGNTNETYVDEYQKASNTAISDDRLNAFLTPTNPDN